MTLKVGRFGQKVRQSGLIWYGLVKHRDDDCGQKGAGDLVARKKKTREDQIGGIWMW